MKVATVTLNPAIDETITLERLVRGQVHRARSVRHDAGGKGVNVASCLADWGLAVTATGLLGIENAGVFETLFEAKGIEDRFVHAPGATRTNIKLVDEDDTTDINLPGLAATPELIDALDAAVAALAGPDRLLVLSGSLPIGCMPDHYARIIEALQPSATRIILDASGEALTAAISAPILPWCIKPNRRELADWAGRPLDDVTDLAAEARSLHRRGIGLVVVSMGAQGALFVSGEGVIHARLPIVELASTVGAGDAMVAGIAAALVEGADLERIARLSTAFAVAKLGRRGPHLPELAVIDALAAEVLVETIAEAGERV